MKHIFRITFVAEDIRTRVFGVASDSESAISLASEKTGIPSEFVTNAVAVGHLDFEEVTTDE